MINTDILQSPVIYCGVICRVVLLNILSISLFTEVLFWSSQHLLYDCVCVYVRWAPVSVKPKHVPGCRARVR